jgi:hypothetical protein
MSSEYTLDYEDACGDWGLDLDNGYSYRVRLWQDEDKRYRFTMVEVQKVGDQVKRRNTLEGWWEIEVESPVLHGERLHSYWLDEDGLEHEETSLYDGDPVMLTDRASGPTSLNVSRCGPFSQLKWDMEFTRGLFDI